MEKLASTVNAGILALHSLDARKVKFALTVRVFQVAGPITIALIQNHVKKENALTYARNLSLVERMRFVECLITENYAYVLMDTKAIQTLYVLRINANKIVSVNQTRNVAPMVYVSILA